MEMPCNLFQLTTFPRCMTNLVLPFRQWGLQMGSAMGLFSLPNDYKYKVNPIDQWVKVLVTVTGFAHAYPLHSLIHHFKIFRQNPEPVAPNFGAKILNKVFIRD